MKRFSENFYDSSNFLIDLLDKVDWNVLAAELKDKARCLSILTEELRDLHDKGVDANDYEVISRFNESIRLMNDLATGLE
jgi:hypothetical protein